MSSSFSSSGLPRVVVSEAEYRDWFDSDGRLVREARMRQRVFEGERAGVSKVNRRESYTIGELGIISFGVVKLLKSINCFSLVPRLLVGREPGYEATTICNMCYQRCMNMVFKV